MSMSSVAAFLAALDHPLLTEIRAVRSWILAADPRITEAVKWNAPSFRTTEFFATFHLRPKDVVQLVFHTGARPKSSARSGLAVPDPQGLLSWRAKDRALVTLGSGGELGKLKNAFTALVRAWVAAIAPAKSAARSRPRSGSAPAARSRSKPGRRARPR